MYLRQSTSQTIRFGPFLDSTDGVTAETALTIAQADMQLSKDGAAFAQKSAAGNATHDTAGWYSTTLSATDTNTVGELILQVNETGALPVWVRWWVLEEDIYDALFGAAADGFDSNGRVDVGSWLGTAAATPTVAGVPEVDVTHLGGAAQSATDLKDFADAGYDPATNKVQGVVLVDTTTTNTDMRGTDNAATAAALATVDANVDAILVDTGTTLPATLTTIAGYIDTEVAAILEDTGTTIPAQISALNNLSAADVNAEVLDVLNTDTFAEPTGVPGATVSLVEKIGRIYQALRNGMTVTATKKTFQDDAGSALWEKDLSDDGTTYTETEGNAP